MGADKPRLYKCPSGCSNGMIQRKVMGIRKGRDGKDESYETWENDYCKTCDGSGYIVGEPG